MFDKKIKLNVTPEEYHIIKVALMEFRNDQMKNGEPADSVNKLLEKILK